MLRNPKSPRVRILYSTADTPVHPRVQCYVRHAFDWVLLAAQEVTLRKQPNPKDSKLYKNRHGITAHFNVSRVRNSHTFVFASRNVLCKGVPMRTGIP